MFRAAPDCSKLAGAAPDTRAPITGRKPMPRISRRLFLSAGAAITLTPALAQSSRTMNLVVPFPPGGSTDALARMLQVSLPDKVGRTVIVENKPGAAGAVGAAQVAKSPADGSTLLVT